jgi:mono/diheme cytochrome c family protein
MKRLFLLLSIAATLASAQSPTGDAKHGKELFLSYACYSCHSFDGHGGARLVPMPLNQPGFIAFIRNAAHAVVRA